jgi:chromosome segregation ATPase
MDLRSTKPGLTAAELFRQANPVVITGYTPKGTPIPSVAGGAPDAGDDDSDPNPQPDDDDDEYEADDDESDADDDDDAKDKKKKSKSKKSSDEEDDDDDEMVPQYKYDKLERRMKAADRRSSELDAENKALRAKLADGKDVSPELKAEIDAMRPKVDKLESSNNQLRLQVAFLTTEIPGVTWVDSEAALRMVDLSDVEIDESGRVDKRALRAALKDLARRKKYLVVARDDEKDDEDQGSTKNSSGPQMNGRRKGKRDTATKEALKSRFPGLRT